MAGLRASHGQFWSRPLAFYLTNRNSSCIHLSPPLVCQSLPSAAKDSLSARPLLSQDSGQCSRWSYTKTVISCLFCSSQEEMYKLRSQHLQIRVSWAEELGSVTPRSRTATIISALHATKLRLGNLPRFTEDAVQEKPPENKLHPPWRLFWVLGSACHEFSTALCSVSCS